MINTFFKSSSVTIFENCKSKMFRIELVGTAVYGLRKYTRGAWLHAHLDHLKTHVVSAILNIAQVVMWSPLSLIFLR